MDKLRFLLQEDTATSEELRLMKDGDHIRVAGLVARPLQHPRANAYFMTLEDEYGFIPLIIWTGVYEQYRSILREPLLLVEGTVSRKQGTLNVVVVKASVPKLKQGWVQDKVSMFIRQSRPMFR